ncbi:MAG: hypothetical protein K6G26_00035 [Lachnospiraceae bacterium]|nr:hypothetical protein [Lachnospiraceae bacterium]
MWRENTSIITYSVYTYPQYRVQRRFGVLLEHICKLAKEDGHSRVYVATEEDVLVLNLK